MSLRGLASEAKNVFKLDRAALFFVIGVVILLTALFYIRNRIHEHNVQASETTLQAAQTKSTIQDLLQLRAQVEGLRSELTDRRNAAATDTTRSAPRNPVSSATTFVGVKPGEGFNPIKNVGDEPYIPMGSVFRARLLMPIKTSVQESFVMAETTHEFRIDSVRRIPRKSRLIGTARLNPMLKGVVVHFHTLVSPGNSQMEFPVSILALSPELFPELNGIYFTNELETYSTVLAFGFLSGFADAAQSREPTIVGSLPRENVANNVLNGVSSASFRVAEQILEDVRRRQVEYVVIPAAENIFLTFDHRFVLKDGKPIPE